MNITRSTAALMGAFSLSASLACGQAVLFFEDIKNFKVTGPETSEYLGGSLDVDLVDGSYTLLPCLSILLNGSIIDFGAFTIFQSPNTSCPAGTTGLISEGNTDFDLDGVRDIGVYISTTQPIPALQVEPFQTSLVELFSAPPSDLPRPLGGFAWEDNSTIIFYDLVRDPRNGIVYELTEYNSSRPYTSLELQRHRDEVVPGSYIFTFPRLNSNPQNPRDFPMNIGHREMVEAFPGPGGQSVVSGGIHVGNDFRITNDDRWFQGVMEFDPRIVSDFTWEGFNAQTFLGSDRLFFAVRDRVTDQIVFPPFPPDQTAYSQLIAGNGLPIANGYEMGPSFFAPGQQVTAELEFRRNSVVGNTIDTSVRFFRWDVDLLDTFAGFQIETFAAGSDLELVAPDADYDGDGYTNLEEFGFQTSPTDPASVPNPTPTIDEFTGHCELVIPKRPGVGSRLIYTIEYSLDLETWTEIGFDDPNWFLVTNNEEEISVFSRRLASASPCFTRVIITSR